MPQEDEKRERFLDHLISNGRLRPAEAAALGKDADKTTPEDLVALARAKGLLSERTATHALADFYHKPFINLEETTFAPSALTKFNYETASKFEVMPFILKNGELSVAMSCMNFDKIDRIRKESGCELLVHLATRSQILAAINLHYATTDIYTNDRMADLGKHLAREADPAIVKDLTQAMVMSALRVRASDIHVEPQDCGLRIRFRVDGVLREEMRLPVDLSEPIIARFKVMADLDVMENRRPQDGRISINTETQSIDLRVSFAPTIFGEKVVVRLLDRSGATTDMKSMEFSKAVSSRLESIVSAPSGIVLVTGPTGSGKSTTCYAILNHLNRPECNIVTIEDPVEYRHEGINQIQVRHGIGVDFSNILRSVLRQDPDIILVGEIRDCETARIAVQAGLTGHLVISTLHTNSAVQALLRLAEMGVEPFLVAPSLNGVVAQRLARRICEQCRTAYNPSSKDLRLFAPYGAQPSELYKGIGCVDCAESGFCGRVPIHEIVVVNTEIRQLIMDEGSIASLDEAVEQQGFRSLRYDGLKKALLGLTTATEVKRTTFAREDFL